MTNHYEYLLDTGPYLQIMRNFALQNSVIISDLWNKFLIYSA